MSKEPIFEGSRPLEEIVNIITYSKWSMKYAIDTINDSARKGGYLCIARPNGMIMAVVLIGTVAKEEKAKKYLSLCQEKALRLALHPEHCSSWQSRDESVQHYGGAIRTKRFIFSFSGFPELWDEAFVVDLASQTYAHPSGLSTVRRNMIKRASNNPYIDHSYGCNRCTESSGD